MAAMLELKNVSKSFGKIVALEDVTFDVDEGEFVFVTGPSGAGKTTLIRMILRDILPDEGEILLAGHNIGEIPKKDIPRLRRRIGVVFQDFKVLPERTLEENVSVALAVCGVDPAEWNDRVSQVLKLVGLSERRSLFPSQLSGGELQRVSLARALVVNPKILLADEPTGNLDWDTSDSIMQLFEKISSEGKSVVMATHNMAIVDKMKKRVVSLDKGKLVKDTGIKETKKQKQKKDKNVNGSKEKDKGN